MVTDSGLHRDVIDLHKQVEILIEYSYLKVALSIHLKLRINRAFIIHLDASNLNASSVLDKDAHSIKAIVLTLQ